jgi:hypothetical protein
MSVDQQGKSRFVATVDESLKKTVILQPGSLLRPGSPP